MVILKLGENGNKSTNTLSLQGLKACAYIAFICILFYSPLRAQQDVGVSTLLNPVSGCSVGLASNPINVIVRNYSLSSAFPNSITVRYSINSGPIVSELIGAILGPNASFNFTFFQKANLSACGDYQIKVWTQKVGDPNPLNDTLTYLFKNDCLPIPGTISGPSLLCNNNNFDSLQVTGGTYSYGYQWLQKIVPGSFTSTGNTSNKFYLNNLGDSTAYYIVYGGGFCANVNSQVFGIGISPNIVTGTISPDLTLCADNIVGNVSVSGFTALIEDWEQSNNSGATWSSIGATNSTVNISYLADSALFRAKIKSGACGSKYSDTISVAIQSLVNPGAISGATPVCFGVNSTTLTLSGHSNNFGFEWFSSTDNITFTPTGITSTSLTATNLTQTTYYKVVSLGDVCSDEETAVVSIIVDPLVNVGTPSPDLNLCKNNVIGSVTLSGFTTTILDWEQSNNGGLSWSSTADNSVFHNISSLTSSASFRAVVGSGTCGTSYSDTIIVLIQDPIIPGSIVGVTSVCSGNNADTLAFVGYANDSGFEWYTSTDNITFTPTGITNDTLITPNLTTPTYYKVILQGDFCPNDETNSYLVNIDAGLDLGIISSDLQLCSDNVTGTVSLSSYSINIFNWEQSNNGGTTWFSTGLNSPSVNISYLTASASYRAVVSAGACGTGISDTINVNIENAVIPGNISNNNSTVCTGANTDTLALLGHANEVSLEWYYSYDNITYIPTGVTVDTLIINNITQSTYYQVFLQGSTNCSNAQSAPIYIQVDSALVIGNVSSDLTLCSSNVAGSVNLTNFSTLFYNWEQSNDGGTTWNSTGVNVPNLDISYLNASASFRAIVTSGACGIGISDTIHITIENAVVPGSIAFGAPVVCSGANIDTLALVGHANELSLEWYSSFDNITFTPTGFTNDTLIVSNSTQSTYYYVFLEGPSICTNEETSVIYIAVDSALNVGTISSDLSFCSNSVVGAVNLTNFSTIFYNWEQSNDGGITWFSTGVNVPNLDISYLNASASFRAEITSGACGAGYSDTIDITIENAVVPGNISNGSSLVCSGSNSDTLVLIGHANEVGLEWYSSTDNLTFTPIGVTSDTLIISNITQSTYYYVFLQGSALCSDAQSDTLYIQVDSVLNTGTVSPDLVLCSNNILGNVSLTNFSTNFFNWEQSNDGGATWTSSGFNTPSIDISYLTTSTLFRGLVTSGVCGSGISDTVSVTIQNAVIPGTISYSAPIVCSGSNSDTLVLVGHANEISLEWFSSLDNITFTPTGITNDTLIATNIAQSTYYSVVLQGSSVCSNEYSDTVFISVDSAVNVGVVSPDLTLCANNVVGTVSLSNFATNFYNWEQSNDNGATWISTGINTPVHDISYLSATALFRAEVNSGTCGTGISDTVQVTIEPQINPGTISGISSVCFGINTDTLVVSGFANQTGFEWYTSADDITYNPTGITNDTLILNNLVQSVYCKVIFTGNTCPNAETTPFFLQVDLPVDVGNISQDLFLCSSSITGTISISNYTSTVLDWEQSNDGGLTWTSTGISTSVLDISFLTSSASFRAIIGSGTCGTGISDTANVIIENAIVPGIISGDTVLCFGTNLDTLVLTGNANEISYEWYTSIGLPYSPSGISNDTFMVTNIVAPTYVKVILQGNYCPSVETPVFLITVDPLPNPGIPSPDLDLCVNNIVGTITILNTPSTVVDWEQSNDGGLNWFSINNSNSILDISFLTASAKFRAILGSGVCATTISDTISVNIIPLGTPATIGFDFEACLGSPELDSMKVISLTGSISNWQYSVNNGITWNNTNVSDTIHYVNYLLGNTIYRVITDQGPCPDLTSNIVTALTNPLPTVSAGSDITINQYNSTQLLGSGGSFGYWTPQTYLSDPTLSSPNCTPDQSTTYAYTVIDINGCMNTDYVNVTVLPDSIGLAFVIYNIVTPNGDGKNDFFTIKGLNTLPNHFIKIFNANGNLVFSSKDYKNDWGATYNDKLVPDGTYLYAVEIDNVTKYRGFLTIMRGND